MFTKRLALTITCILAGMQFAAAQAEEAKSFLETTKKHTTLTSTVAENGDQNPYAIVVAPVTSGSVQKGDVLVSNFNNSANLQGTGSTIINYSPTTKKMSLFAQIPADLKNCPGGIGLSTAMTMLESGWVIVGSAPSKDGTTATKGEGCLIVLDSNGKVNSAIAGKNINAPWGNMAVIDNGNTATLFVSNIGFGVSAPDEKQTVSNHATILRLDLTIAQGKAPVVKKQTVIAGGLSSRADKDAFIIGPTGMALGKNGVLYVSDTLDNRIIAIDNAVKRKDNAKTGREITKDGALNRPLAMTITPNGNLLVTNGHDGQAVEIDPETGKQVHTQWLDANRAQTPPGNGDLFGITMAPDNKSFYFVQDDMNTLVIAQ